MNSDHLLSLLHKVTDILSVWTNSFTSQDSPIFQIKRRLRKENMLFQGHKEVVRLGFEPICQIQYLLDKIGKESSPILALGTGQGGPGWGRTPSPLSAMLKVHMALFYYTLFFFTSPTLTENRRGPPEKSILEGMWCTEGSKPVPHVESSSLQDDSLSVKKDAGIWEGTEGGRKEPFLFKGAPAFGSWGTLGVSVCGGQFQTCQLSTLLKGQPVHLLPQSRSSGQPSHRVLNFWASNLNIKK